jgi:hypothetical protein
MTDTHKIQWKRVGIEATAVVASILIAFSIDAWWDDLQEQRRAHGTLQSLEAGFSSSLDLIDANLIEVQASQVTVRRFLNMSPEDAAAIPPGERDSILDAIWRPRTLDLNNHLLVAMLESEGIETLDSPALQESIAQWRDSVEELNELKAKLADSQQDIILALGHYPELWKILSQQAADRPTIGGDLMRRIRSDQYFMALTARKAFSIRGHIRTMLAIREGTDSVLLVLDSSLADRS